MFKMRRVNLKNWREKLNEFGRQMRARKKVDDTKAKELERKILTILLEHKYYNYNFQEHSPHAPLRIQRT